jgi:hypothetical protein
LTGSSDLYQDDGRTPSASINFVTAHDGFTLRDLVCYNEKHNIANGENNQDGESHNRSWNLGAEGVTKDEAINAARRRQQRNFLATLMVSQGVLMLLGGDEIGRTQQGNNNAYCQDNEISWFDWPISGADAAGVHAPGQFLNGSALRSRDAHGQRIYDDSFVLMFNAHVDSVIFSTPAAPGRALDHRVRHCLRAVISARGIDSRRRDATRPSRSVTAGPSSRISGCDTWLIVSAINSLYASASRRPCGSSTPVLPRASPPGPGHVRCPVPRIADRRVARCRQCRNRG